MNFSYNNYNVINLFCYFLSASITREMGQVSDKFFFFTIIISPFVFIRNFVKVICQDHVFVFVVKFYVK